MNDTARRVREDRQALGWSQDELAKKAGCDVRTVRRLEAGERVSPATLTEVTTALKRARPVVEPKPTPSAITASAAEPSAPTSPPEASGEELNMTETVQDEMTSAPEKPTPEVATFGELMKLHAKDPAAAEQIIMDMLPKPRAPETTEEKLTMGYAVIQFLEQFENADVYVMWDTGDPDERKILGAFIATATQAAKAIRERAFDSAQRFQAQCAFADQLNELHKKKWRVLGLVTRSWNLEGYSSIAGNIVIDQG